MKIIGITGPSGSGKTSLTEYFTSKGYPCIDADQVYHSMLIPPSRCLDAIKDSFGDELFFNDGTLNRPMLADIVFNDPKKLKLLNTTVLTLVIEEINLQITAYELKGFDTVIIDAPTLIESGFDSQCDTVISVISDVSRRIKRISARDGITHEKAAERVNAQKPDSFYIEHSDTVLYNNGTEEEFFAQVKQKLIF